jgi:hypothetical protein
MTEGPLDITEVVVNVPDDVAGGMDDAVASSALAVGDTLLQRGLWIDVGHV